MGKVVDYVIKIGRFAVYRKYPKGYGMIWLPKYMGGFKCRW